MKKRNGNKKNKKTEYSRKASKLGFYKCFIKYRHTKNKTWLSLWGFEKLTNGKASLQSVFVPHGSFPLCTHNQLVFAASSNTVTPFHQLKKTQKLVYLKLPSAYYNFMEADTNTMKKTLLHGLLISGGKLPENHEFTNCSACQNEWAIKTT